MKIIRNIFLLLLLFSVLPVYSGVFSVRIGGRNLTVETTTGWKRIRSAAYELLTLVRGKDILGLRVDLVKDKYAEYLRMHEYNIKRVARRMEKDRKIFIEGVEFHEFVSERILPNKKPEYQRMLITNNGNAAIVFRYVSFERKNFLRTLEEMNTVVSGFLRNNFLR